MFFKNVNWIHEVPPFTIKFNKIVHFSAEMFQACASPKRDVKEEQRKMKDKRNKKKPKYAKRDIVRTADKILFFQS